MTLHSAWAVVSGSNGSIFAFDVKANWKIVVETVIIFINQNRYSGNEWNVLINGLFTETYL